MFKIKSSKYCVRINTDGLMGKSCNENPLSRGAKQLPLKSSK